MKLTALLLLVAGFSAAAEQPKILGPYSTTINLTADLVGEPDTRPCCWGTAGAQPAQIKFAAPAGYRTRILRVYGDFVAWSKAGVIPTGTTSEVGWGIKSTKADGSTLVSFPGYTAQPFDNSMYWLQNVVTQANTSPRATFDVDVHVGGLLEKDNILISQCFVALNQTGLMIHMEPTWSIVYQFEVETQ